MPLLRTRVAMAESMPSLERGVIDGLFTSACDGDGQEYWRVAKYDIGALSRIKANLVDLRLPRHGRPGARLATCALAGDRGHRRRLSGAGPVGRSNLDDPGDHLRGRPGHRQLVAGTGEARRP